MSQAVGLSEAAYQEAYAYAIERKQFGQTIDNFPAVYEMLSIMRAKTDASRAHLYETCRFVDMYKTLEDIQRERKLTPEERKELKYYTRLADAFTPIGKGLSTEFANQNVYDCVQIHGGSGYMKDYTCERLYRDVRITNIYEGTTQLQVVAAIRHVTTGTYYERMHEYQATEVKPEWQAMKESLAAMNERAHELTQFVVEQKNQELLDFQARRLVEMTSHALFGHLLLLAANDEPELFGKSARVYHRFALAEQDKIERFVRNFAVEELADYRNKQQEAEA